MTYHVLVFFFFFQAEDGIRDYKVTGVQTCALPICHGHARSGPRAPGAVPRDRAPGGGAGVRIVRFTASPPGRGGRPRPRRTPAPPPGARSRGTAPGARGPDRAGP